MLTKITTYLFPNLSKEEQHKFWRLGGILALILGAYWILKITKNTLVFKTADLDGNDSKDFFLSLKFLQPFVMLIIVMAYSPYISKTNRKKFLYIMWRIFFIIFLLFAFIFLLRFFFPEYFQGNALIIICSAAFFAVESFGAISIPIFWAFNNSITLTQSAKKGFPLILAIGHVGALISSSLPIIQDKLIMFDMHENVRILSIFLLGSIFIAIASQILKNTIFPMPVRNNNIDSENDNNKNNNNKSLLKDLFSGGYFIIKNPYLMGVFVLSTFYEIFVLILETGMNDSAKAVFSANQFINFQSTYSIIVQLTTIFFAGFVISPVLLRLGTRFALLILPVSTVLLCGLTSWMVSTVLSGDLTSSAYLLTANLILLKGMIYAVNYPCKEMMWIPTSKDIKFKAKGWVDSFGGRLIKSSASITYKNIYNNPIALYTIGIPIIVLWILSAIGVGIKNKKLLDKNEILK